jgi:hypothetical protein
MESVTAPTIGMFRSRSPSPVFGNPICQTWATLYNFGLTHVRGAGTGTAKVAGMRASTRVEKCMAIDVFEKERREQRTTLILSVTI